MGCIIRGGRAKPIESVDGNPGFFFVEYTDVLLDGVDTTLSFSDIPEQNASMWQNNIDYVEKVYTVATVRTNFANFLLSFFLVKSGKTKASYFRHRKTVNGIQVFISFFQMCWIYVFNSENT